MKRKSCATINREFMDAIKEGNLNKIQILIEEGADVNDIDQNGLTSLHYAADNGYVDVVQFLLEKGAQIYNEVFSTYATHIAAYHGYIDVVKLFFEYGVNLDICEPGNGNTLLHEASGEGHLNLAEYLIENGANMNFINGKGEKPMHTAAKNGHKDVVKLFVEFGVDPNTREFFGYTALHKACEEGHVDVVQYLIENAADIDAKYEGNTSLHIASKLLDTDIMKCLLEAGASSDIKDKEGHTMLLYFIYNYVRYIRHVYPIAQEIFERINNYTDIDDNQKKTAVHTAVEYYWCDIKFLKLVLQKQKDINIEDINGNTPLNNLIKEWSIERGDMCTAKAVRLLIDNGAYLKTIDCHRIIANPSLRHSLFTDIKLCTQSIVNKFNNKDLPTLYGLSLSVPLPSIEKLKVNSSQIRKIKHAVKTEIRNEGYCDLSKIVPTLTMLAVESYISRYFSICG